MTYQQLLHGVPYRGEVPAGDTSLVTQDSRRVKPGAVFVCIQGDSFDGHAYAQSALQAGAGLLVCERPLGLANEVQVADSRRALAQMSANYFGHPGEKMQLIAVTGTNGKTTVSSVLKQVLCRTGHPCGLIGTIRNEIGDMIVPAKFTTPEAWDLNALLARMAAAGCTHAVLEASSQALAQGRLYGLHFSLGIFTNLTRDHLDYHGSMQAYYEAKKSLFFHCDAMLVNADDAFGQRLLAEVDGPRKVRFSVGGEGEYVAEDVVLGPGSVRFLMQEKEAEAKILFPMPGDYSACNALAVAGAGRQLGCSLAEVEGALAHSKGIPGRCEVLYDKEFTIIRDFAHTADAMEKLLCALHPHAKKRFVVLYGCAGERDDAKRLPMGQAAAKYGDEIFLTNDNPRRESPEKIIAATEPALRESGKPYHVIEDRQEAVKAALACLHKGDMLVLCSKGHEDYQVMDGYTLYLNEAQIVQEWLSAHRY